MMIVSTLPNKESRSKEKLAIGRNGSTSVEGVSEVNLKETPLMVLARRKTAAYRDNHVSDT